MKRVFHVERRLMIRRVVLLSLFESESCFLICRKRQYSVYYHRDVPLPPFFCLFRFTESILQIRERKRKTCSPRCCRPNTPPKDERSVFGRRLLPLGRHPPTEKGSVLSSFYRRRHAEGGGGGGERKKKKERKKRAEKKGKSVFRVSYQ